MEPSNARHAAIGRNPAKRGWAARHAQVRLTDRWPKTIIRLGDGQVPAYQTGLVATVVAWLTSVDENSWEIGDRDMAGCRATERDGRQEWWGEMRDGRAGGEQQAE